MAVNFLSGSKQSDSSNDEDHAYDYSDMQQRTWAKLGVERPRFPFSVKPGLNVHLEDPNNPVVCFEFLITPEVAELISIEINRGAQQFL
jgi:hypothetical protein